MTYYQLSDKYLWRYNKRVLWEILKDFRQSMAHESSVLAIIEIAIPQRRDSGWFDYLSYKRKRMIETLRYLRDTVPHGQWPEVCKPLDERRAVRKLFIDIYWSAHRKSYDTSSTKKTCLSNELL